MKKLLAVALAAVALAACKRSQAPAEAQPASVAAPPALPPGPPAPGDPMGPGGMGDAGDRARAQAMITDENLASFATYMRAMQPFKKAAADLAVAVGDAATPPADGSRERLHAEFHATALQESGLVESDLRALSLMVAPYYLPRIALSAAVARAAEFTQKDPGGRAAETGARGPAREFAAVRERFERRYGPEVMAVLDRHEATFRELAGPPRERDPAE